MPLPQRMTQNPDPCVPGGSVEFCYDIDGATLPVTLDGTWDPSGRTFSHTVTGASDRCWTESVPDDAEGGTIEDATAQSKTFGIFVSP